MNNKEIIFDFSRQSKKFFEKHKNIKEKFIANITDYVNRTRDNFDIKRLVGNDFYYRMRIGKYRIIYMVINKEIVVVRVLSADSCGDIYK